jgi:hypothetical protein
LHKKVDNVHWTNYAASLGYGDHGGAYAQYDDGNPAWVDVDEEEDGQHDPEGQEARWRADVIWARSGNRGSLQELHNDGY